MARPKKRSVTPEDISSASAFQQTYGDPLPARVDLLQETICALLNRMRRMDEETARQVAVFLRVLAARCAYWDKARSAPQDGLQVNQEWGEYRDLLCEIALGKKTKMTHCKQSVLEQGQLLDQYLEEHGEFARCRNLTTRLEWLARHEEAMRTLLTVIPCFCVYKDALEPTAADREVLSATLTRATLRNLILGMLHCTTPKQIGKIRKGPTAFTTDDLLFCPLDSAIRFPSFDEDLEDLSEIQYP